MLYVKFCTTSHAFVPVTLITHVPLSSSGSWSASHWSCHFMSCPKDVNFIAVLVTRATRWEAIAIRLDAITTSSKKLLGGRPSLLG